MSTMRVKSHSGVTLPDDAEVADRLRAAGIKVTAGRLRVLRVLSVAHEPLCHSELEAQLVRAGEAAINRVTLYRILNTFVQHGLLLKASDARGVFRYSLAGASHGHGEHLHFRCVDCGGVFCLEAAPPPPPVLPDGFRLTEIALDLRGHCARCVMNDAGPLQATPVDGTPTASAHASFHANGQAADGETPLP